MKLKYRMFRRGQVFWCQDNQTGRQESLGTKDRTLAERLLHARNEAHQQPLINLQIARAYLLVSDPQIGKRSWQDVMDELVKLKRGVTQVRWLVAIKDRSYDGFRHLPLLETRPEHLLRAMESGKVSTNVFLRRIHNFAVAMNWLPVPVIPRRQWPGFRFGEKRAVTAEEHQAIIAREHNPERHAFYELAWHLGASQSDLAFLEADNIDWQANVISFQRRKTGQLSQVHFDPEVEAVLKNLPRKGPLFPYLRRVRACDRATEFKQRCHGLGIYGVTLHSYRYAWAERARRCGYPERFAQEALGHNSKAVHRAYARKAKVILPSLGSFEKQSQEGKIVPFPSVKAAAYLPAPIAKT
jgi:integrase